MWLNMGAGDGLGKREESRIGTLFASGLVHRSPLRCEVIQGGE